MVNSSKRVQTKTGNNETVSPKKEGGGGGGATRTTHKSKTNKVPWDTFSNLRTESNEIAFEKIWNCKNSSLEVVQFE